MNSRAVCTLPGGPFQTASPKANAWRGGGLGTGWGWEKTRSGGALRHGRPGPPLCPLGAKLPPPVSLHPGFTWAVTLLAVRFTTETLPLPRRAPGGCEDAACGAGSGGRPGGLGRGSELPWAPLSSNMHCPMGPRKERVPNAAARCLRRGGTRHTPPVSGGTPAAPATALL